MKRLIVLLVAVIAVASLFAIRGTQAQEGANQPVVAVDQLAVQAGMTINYIANGLPGDAQLVVGMGPVDSEYDVLENVTSSTQGAVSGSIAVPTFVQPGENWVLVIATPDNSVRAISYPILITDGTDSATVPDVFIAPHRGAPGTEVQIRGINFPANSSVLVGVGRQLSDFSFSFRVTTDANGTFTDTFSIPETANPGSNWVALAELEENRNFETTSGTFSVIGAPQPAPEPDTGFESADIYLVAIGDAGQSGIEIGCNDSVIPVEVQFGEPTVAPLTATLENLLAFDEQLYGRSGLYNALFPSELTVDGINLENGVATIDLSGSLAIGGVCDGPRIRAQIAQTALQFSTVDEVNILINDIPYDEFTSAQ